ncbi:MAG: ABC transporter permease [Candidatus Acidiferrum sp.]
MPEWESEILRRLAPLKLSPTREAEIADELAQHLEDRYQELLASGITDDEARRAAVEELEGEDLLARGLRPSERDLYREPVVWGKGSDNLFAAILQDVRYALRMFRKSPGFTAVAVLTLALGIGANAGIFSVVNAVVLAPLAYLHADRLVQLELTFPDGNQKAVSVAHFNIWRRQTQAFDAIAAYDFSGPGINLTGNGLPEQLKGIRASAGYFDVYSVPMARGRAYTMQEDVFNGPNVAVISNALWRGRFGGDPNIIGRTIELGGEANTIVGVTGPAFHSDPRLDVWLPLRPDPDSTDQVGSLISTALLKSGVTLAQAQAATKLAAAEFRQKFPGDAGLGSNGSFTAVPLKDVVIGDVRKGLLLLLGAVGFVLLIACANVANLLLARATLRKREIALRAALGAGRRRIIEQLLTESVLLALIGGVLGFVIGYVAVKALLAASPVSLPRIGKNGVAVALDWRVLGFTLLITVVTGILFGLIPALNASRTDLSATLKETGTRTGSSLRQNKLRSMLVVTEIALALILLVGAALLIRTFAVLRGVNPGFDAHNVLAMNMSLSGGHFTKAAAMELLDRNGRQRIETVPGIEAAAMTCCLPFEGAPNLGFLIVGRSPQNAMSTGFSDYMLITPEYFKVFRIPLINGRVFNDQDSGAGERAVIINEAMARQYWPKRDAVGSQIVIAKGAGPEFDEGPRQVVGIVGDIRAGGLDQPPSPTMYIPLAQTKDGIIALFSRVAPMIWVVRTRTQPFALSDEIQRELREASGGLPVANIRSMEQVTADSLARNDFNTTLLTIFAGIALLLAAIGIYGLMAYSVQQRTQEIGIRLALGASPERVLGMVVRQGMLLAGIGVVIGVGGALGLTRLMSGMIYGVKTWDPVTFVAVVVVLSCVSLLATYVPARRTSRVDPIIALRYE